VCKTYKAQYVKLSAINSKAEKKINLHKKLQFDVHESVNRDATMKITNKMHYID